MARTRSGRLNSVGRRADVVPDQQNSMNRSELEGDGSDLEGAEGIERYLSKARTGLRRLNQRCDTLKKENEGLRAEVDKLVEAQDVSIQPKRGKKGGPSAATLQAEIRKLKGEVRSLKSAKDKLRKRVEQLEVKETKREAAELNEDTEDAADDSSYHMRKLLRRFQDLMSETVLDENEECIICMEKLKPEETSSFPCEHLVCNTCLPQIAPGSEVINCPQCRKLCNKSSIEVVYRTASQQWDALMEVAKKWAKMDLRREVSSSEEEAEARFIDDAGSETTENPKDAELESTMSALESTPEPLTSATLPSTPPPSGSNQAPATPLTSYLQSPTADKRKRMQELVEQRKRKKGAQ